MSSICGNFPYFLKMTVCLISLSSSSACPLVFFQISIAHILLLEFVFCAMCSVGFQGRENKPRFIYTRLIISMLFYGSSKARELLFAAMDSQENSDSLQNKRSINSLALKKKKAEREKKIIKKQIGKKKEEVEDQREKFEEILR